MSDTTDKEIEELLEVKRMYDAVKNTTAEEYREALMNYNRREERQIIIQEVVLYLGEHGGLTGAAYYLALSPDEIRNRITKAEKYHRDNLEAIKVAPESSLNDLENMGRHNFEELQMLKGAYRILTGEEYR